VLIARKNVLGACKKVFKRKKKVLGQNKIVVFLKFLLKKKKNTKQKMLNLVKTIKKNFVSVLLMYYTEMSESHSKTKCKHFENREKVCLPCGRKIKYRKNEKVKCMNEKEKNLVKKYCMKEFTFDDERYPTGKNSILNKLALHRINF